MVDRRILLALLSATSLTAPAAAQFNGIFADFDVGTTTSPEIPGPLSFPVYLDSTTGLSDTANESAPDDFKSNLHTVCQHSYRLMEQLIPALAP